MNTIRRIAEIKRACAEWVCFSAGHETRQVGLPLDHFLRREPIRPFLHAADAFGAGPRKAFAADADAVTDRLAVTEHEIEIGVRRIDDDRACRFDSSEADNLTPESLRQFFPRSLLGLVFRRQRRNYGPLGPWRRAITARHVAGRRGIAGRARRRWLRSRWLRSRSATNRPGHIPRWLPRWLRSRWLRSRWLRSRSATNRPGHIRRTADVCEFSRRPLRDSAIEHRHGLRREKRTTIGRPFVYFIARCGLNVARIDRNASGVAIDRRGPDMAGRGRGIIGWRIILRRSQANRTGQRQGDY